MSKDIHDYSDIINLEPHKSKNHPRMDKNNRASQFAPFAALVGYQEAINECGRLVDKKRILTNEEKERISNILNYIKNNLKEEIIINVIYFIKDQKKDGGKIESYRGVLRLIDEFNMFIQFSDYKKININDILKINLENIDYFNFK